MTKISCGYGLLVVGLLVSFHVRGEAPTTSGIRPTTLDEARKLQERGKYMKAEADRQFELERLECNKKVLVANCVESAKTRKRTIWAEASKLEQSGREGERQVRRNDRQARESQHADGAEQRAAEEASRIEQLHQDQQRHAAERVQQRDQVALEVERRRAKNQTEEAARQARLEQDARKAADLERLRPSRMQEQQRREKEIAEHAEKIAERARQHAEDVKRRESEAAAKLAAQEAARKNAAERVSFLCQLWPERFCPGLGSTK